MYNNQRTIYFGSKRASLFSIAVLVYLLSAQTCHGCSDGCNNARRERRDRGTAIGFGRGWISSRNGQDAGDSRHDFEYKDVVGLSPDTDMIIGGRSGSAAGKDLVFGEGFAKGSGDRGMGIHVKDGTISGRGIGIAIEKGKDDHQIRWKTFDPFDKDGKGFDGRTKTEFRGIAVASASMAKCYAMSYFLVFIIFLLCN